MPETEYKKCEFQKGGYAKQFCEALSDTLQVAPTKKSKGLFVGNIVNTSTNENLGRRVLLKSGEKHLNEGIVFNICPFCGGSLRDISCD